MIFLHDSELVHVDSYVDIIEHYGVKGMKWGKHRANMRDARRLRKSTRRQLDNEEATIGNRYGILYALGEEGRHANNRVRDFRRLAERRANNDISVKKQKYIDKYSTDGTINGLNDKGKKKYTRLQSKAKRLADKHYEDIDFGYRVNKSSYV